MLRRERPEETKSWGFVSILKIDGYLNVYLPPGMNMVV
jgi:hypothetical protein